MLPVLITVIVAVVPPLAMALSAVVITAVICVLLINVVVLADPFHLTVDRPLIKFVPFNVSTKDAPSAVPLVGEMLVVVGVAGVSVYV